METQNSMPPVSEPKPTKQQQWILVGLIVILVSVIILGALLVLSKSKDDNSSNQNNNTAQNESNKGSNNNSNKNDGSNSDEITLIKDIGIDLDYYNEATGKAGEIVFTNEPLGEYNMPYFDYGFSIEASSAGQARLNPQPTFVVPLGTKVRSLIDGVVVNVPQLYSGDYSVHVASSKESQYIYETEHVINPTVKVGDRVTAGQVIAEVSDYDARNYSGYGLYEIGILKAGNPPSHICPFNYLDASIKSGVHSKLLDFYKEWNKFKGEEIYNENPVVPGCITLEEVPG